MKYLELREALKDFSVFSLNDIRQIDKSFYHPRLSEWQHKGYIKKIIRGYYIFSDLKTNEQVLFEIANRIYSPSYISLEMALSYYSLIPESVYRITSISTRKTKVFNTQIGDFSYRSVKTKLYFGYDLIEYGNKIFKIALLEKAILDYFYLNSKIQTKEDFESLRINVGIFFDKVLENKMDIFLDKYSNKALEKRIKVFWKFIKNA
jgi:predicted transcriptional regulator of viral defense system